MFRPKVAIDVSTQGGHRFRSSRCFNPRRPSISVIQMFQPKVAIDFGHPDVSTQGGHQCWSCRCPIATRCCCAAGLEGWLTKAQQSWQHTAQRRTEGMACKPSCDTARVRAREKPWLSHAAAATTHQQAPVRQLVDGRGLHGQPHLGRPVRVPRGVRHCRAVHALTRQAHALRPAARASGRAHVSAKHVWCACGGAHVSTVQGRAHASAARGRVRVSAPYEDTQGVRACACEGSPPDRTPP